MNTYDFLSAMSNKTLIAIYKALEDAGQWHWGYMEMVRHIFYCRNYVSIVDAINDGWGCA